MGATSKSERRRSARSRLLRPWAVAGLIIAALDKPVAAQDATWKTSPVSGDYGLGANWDPGAPTRDATFGFSNVTALTIGPSATSIDSWTFSPGASSYTFDTMSGNIFGFYGAGIIIQGGSATINNDGFLDFANASTAGNATIVNTGNGHLQFVG